MEVGLQWDLAVLGKTLESYRIRDAENHQTCWPEISVQLRWGSRGRLAVQNANPLTLTAHAFERTSLKHDASWHHVLQRGGEHAAKVLCWSSSHASFAAEIQQTPTMHLL
jgi:hypothetical protein